VNDGMLRERKRPTARFGPSHETRRALILIFWVVLICCVVVGSLAPAASSLMVVIGRLHIWDKLDSAKPPWSSAASASPPGSPRPIPRAVGFYASP